MSGILLLGAIPLVPGWWTLASVLLWVVLAIWGIRGWRQTAKLLVTAIGYLVLLIAVTLILR